MKTIMKEQKKAKNHAAAMLLTLAGCSAESSSGEETTTISLTVRYTQDTQFLIEFVSSDGSSSSQSEGTSADLENGRMVILDGIMENEVFKNSVFQYHFTNIASPKEKKRYPFSMAC